MYALETQELRSAKVRVSVPRLVILEYLNRTCCTHPTAEEIYANIQKEGHNLAFATVYNTLNLFLTKKLVNPIELPGQPMRFDRLTKQHAHFHCKACQKIQDLPLKIATEDVLNLPAEYQVHDVLVIVNGTCSDCNH